MKKVPFILTFPTLPLLEINTLFPSFMVTVVTSDVANSRSVFPWHPWPIIQSFFISYSYLISQSLFTVVKYYLSALVRFQIQIAVTDYLHHVLLQLKIS